MNLHSTYIYVYMRYTIWTIRPCTTKILIEKICSKQYFATVSYDKVLMDAANYSTACNCFQPEQPEVRIQAQI